MRTAAICPTCATYINALCVIYDGPGLTNINVAPLDNLDDILQSINDNLVPIHGSGAPTNGAVYEGQLYIDDVTGEVYIATTTGGGAGDWEQLALQSAIPPTPSLDDVLLAGNASTQNIIIEDNLITPTTVATISPLFVSVFDVASGDVTKLESKALSFYDGASGFTATITAPATFTANTTIAFPSSSGTIALLSDITASQNLQTVLTAGNIATGVGMLIENAVISVYNTGVINNIDIDGTTGSIRITTAGGTGEILATNLTANQSFELPDNSGTFALTSDITPATLQAVTAGTNKDLIDGINLQGTGAGTSQTGTDVIGIGTNAADSNTGSDVIAIGNNAGNTNTGSELIGIGTNAGFNNSGYATIAIGFGALSANTQTGAIGIGISAGNSNTGVGAIAIGGNALDTNSGTNSIGIGANAGFNNSGYYLVAIGQGAGTTNIADDLVAIGRDAGLDNWGDSVIGIGVSAGSQNRGSGLTAVGIGAGLGNLGNNVVAIGASAGQTNGLNGMTIFSNSSLPSYLDFAAASVAINVGTGATTGTYLYHDQTTNSIGAVRIP